MLGLARLQGSVRYNVQVRTSSSAIQVLPEPSIASVTSHSSKSSIYSSPSSPSSPSRIWQCHHSSARCGSLAPSYISNWCLYVICQSSPYDGMGSLTHSGSNPIPWSFNTYASKTPFLIQTSRNALQALLRKQYTPVIDLKLGSSTLSLLCRMLALVTYLFLPPQAGRPLVSATFSSWERFFNLRYTPLEVRV